jgi:hypothetical protein
MACWALMLNGYEAGPAVEDGAAPIRCLRRLQAGAMVYRYHRTSCDAVIEQVSARLREQVFERVWGRCECIETVCGTHVGRCGEALRGRWVVACIDPSSEYTLSNVRGLCSECAAALAKLGQL